MYTRLFESMIVVVTEDYSKCLPALVHNSQTAHLRYGVLT